MFTGCRRVIWQSTLFQAPPQSEWVNFCIPCSVAFKTSPQLCGQLFENRNLVLSLLHSKVMAEVWIEAPGRQTFVFEVRLLHAPPQG